MRQRVRHSPFYRNVVIDDRWATFQGFLANPPGGQFEPGMALCRIGDVGPYSPENARWMTKSQNSREAVERRMVRLADGRLALDAARANGVSPKTFRDRLGRGWTPEQAASIEAPPSRRGKTKPHLKYRTPVQVEWLERRIRTMGRQRPEGKEADELLALRAISESIQRRGYPPSQREISAACGWSSPSGANTLIKLMEARGLIEVTPGIPRALRITPEGDERITGTKMVADTEAV